MKRLAPLSLIAALALTGCVSAEPSAESKQAPTETTASETTEVATPTAKPSATKAVDKSQAWADDMINLLLNGNSKSSFDDFSPEIAHHYIESWSQPKPGVLAIKVQDKKWSNCDLDSLGMNVLDTAGWDNPKLKLVEVSAGDSKPRVMDRNNEYAVPSSCA